MILGPEEVMRNSKITSNLSLLSEGSRLNRTGTSVSQNHAQKKSLWFKQGLVQQGTSLLPASRQRAECELAGCVDHRCVVVGS